MRRAVVLAVLELPAADEREDAARLVIVGDHRALQILRRGRLGLREPARAQRLVERLELLLELRVGLVVVARMPLDPIEALRSVVSAVRCILRSSVV